MSYEDLITIKAFLVALKSLDQPLPEGLQTDLGAIASTLPESAYELHDLAERYEPLNQHYLAALQDLPGEGERLKSASLKVQALNDPTSDTESTEVEKLIQQLRERIIHQQIQCQQPVEHCSRPKRLVKDLDWTEEQIVLARYIFKPFQEDWDDPAMEIYDDL